MSDTEEPTCTEDTNEILNDESHCGFITKPDGPFAACLAEDPERTSYFNDCVYDSCEMVSNITLVKEQVCNTLADLWLECADPDIIYRTPEMCPPSKSNITIFVRHAKTKSLFLSAKKELNHHVCSPSQSKITIFVCQ